ncbi:MAG: hypothetical protein M1522_02000 [Actinobacteria bacterium]|jgi:hypothetical protein|nr:hypothetical protein [Actinomycetota bacterium]MDA8185492.1 hypothetical protein [Actinomycetota bacterium]
MGRIEVVLDAPTIAAALAQIGPVAIVFPEVPPLTGVDAVDALGVFAYVADAYFAHIVSDEIIAETVKMLTDMQNWGLEEARAGIELVFDQAEDGGGGLVRAERGISVPGVVADSTKTAIRAAATKDVGYPRLVVTSDPAALEIGELQPHGVPFPKDETLRFWSPASFARFAVDVRLKRRPIPPGRT